MSLVATLATATDGKITRETHGTSFAPDHRTPCPPRIGVYLVLPSRL